MIDQRQTLAGNHLLQLIFRRRLRPSYRHVLVPETWLRQCRRAAKPRTIKIGTSVEPGPQVTEQKAV